MSRPRRPLTVLLAALALVLGLSVVVAPTAGAAPGLTWQLRPTGGTNHFRGLSPVSAQVAWISGYAGQVLRTVDGGTHWTDVSPKGLQTEALQFRDVEAFDTDHAVVMAAGSGTDSQLLVTANGGRTWTRAYRNTDPAAFFDCMSFSDALNGLVMSDPVGGKFRILATTDGGRSWKVQPTAGTPPALTGEAGFAASGQCLTTSGNDAWFGTGGGSVARVFHSTDDGLTWTATASSLGSTASGGVFGLAFVTPSRGVVVGGDFNAPAASAGVAATQLVGRPWRPADTMPAGYRSGVTFVPGTLGTVLAVGLTGSSVSTDGGKNWTTFDSGPGAGSPTFSRQFDTVSCTADGACWAAGDKGRVGVLQGR